MRVSANVGCGGIGDPAFEASRRWRLCTALGAPTASWMMRGYDADALEQLLSDHGSRGERDVLGDAGIAKIIRGVTGTTTPGEVLAQLEALALERDPPPLPPVTVDRNDPLAQTALDCSLGIEAHAADLLGREDARTLLGFVERRIPRAHMAKIASVIRVSVELARARVVELLVDMAVLDVERAEREALEAPAREAAARVQAAAAAARARIEAEIP